MADWSLSGIYLVPRGMSPDDATVSIGISKDNYFGVSKAVPTLVLFYPLHDGMRNLQGLIIGASVIPFFREELFDGFRVGFLEAAPSISSYTLTTFGIR